MSPLKSRKKGKLYNLERHYMNATVRWAHDFDYLQKLSPKDRLWMNKFIGEYYDGAVQKDDTTALHKTLAEKRDCWQRKNKMRNDVLTVAQVRKRLKPIP